MPVSLFPQQLRRSSMHAATTTDEWDLESIPSSELASLASPSMLAEDDYVQGEEAAPGPPDYDSVAASATSLPEIPGLVLESFIPLLDTIQSSLTIQENEYHLVNEIDKSEWKALQEHARAVEELTLSDTALPRVSASIFFRLGQLQGADTPLFPTLRRLHIAHTTTTTTSAVIPYLDLFFTPSLRALHIKGITGTTTMPIARFLRKAAAHAQGMRELVLDALCLSPEILTAIGACVRLSSLALALTDLTGVEYTSLGAVVGCLPNLQAFSIDVRDVTQVRGLAAAATARPVAPRFLCLQSFSFVGAFSALVGVVDDGLVDAPLLHKVRIEVTKYDPSSPAKSKGGSKLPPGAAMHDIIKRISTDRQSQLTELTFIVPRSGITATPLPTEIIDTLAALRNLTHLELAGPGITSLDSALLGAVSVPWPKLITLRLPVPTAHNATYAHGLSLSTLARLARACPDLRLLHAPVVLPDVWPLGWAARVDALHMPSGCAPPVPVQALLHGLRTLSLGCVGAVPQVSGSSATTRGPLARYIATYLYGLFPDADVDAGADGHGNREHVGFWQEVGECMRMCRDAREIDRSRGSLSSS